MAASVETQRLISVSLGKIAQSRGQRGGINLHKNLLVATVLHKARTAYMMEYSYQQTFQRQSLLQQQQQLQQQQSSQSFSVSAPVQQSSMCPSSTSPCDVSEKEVCHAPRDANLGQPGAQEAESDVSGPVTNCNDLADVCEEPMTAQNSDCSELRDDKENLPPFCTSVSSDVASNDCSTFSSQLEADLSSCDHLAAATQLSIDAQLAADQSNISGKPQVLTSGTTTTITSSSSCNVLKRRRDNPSACSQDYESPASKKARVAQQEWCVPPTHLSGYASDGWDASSDDSDSDSEPELMHTCDSPQISNLVTIFSSGFSGLCPISSSDSDSSSGCTSDLGLSNSTSHFIPLSKMRPQSPSPAFSRSISEPSLTCSSHVGRLESMPSAIVLSA